MPYTQFGPGAEDIAYSAFSSAKKTKKNPTGYSIAGNKYVQNIMGQTKKSETKFVNDIISAENAFQAAKIKRGPSPYARVAGRTKPTKQWIPISYTDFESGNLSPEVAQDLYERSYGRSPGGASGMEALVGFGIPSVARIVESMTNKGADYRRPTSASKGARIFGQTRQVSAPVSPEGGIVSSIIDKLDPNTKQAYMDVTNEYGENVGLRSYTTPPVGSDFATTSAMLLPSKAVGPVIKGGVKLFAKGASKGFRGASRVTASPLGKAAAAGLASSAGLAAYNEANPNEAQAFSLSRFKRLVDIGDEAAINAYARAQAKKITARVRKRIWEATYPDIPWSKRPKGQGWYNAPEFAGTGLEQSITTDDVLKSAHAFLKTYENAPLGRRLLRMPMKGKNSGSLHWGHDIPLEIGGPISEGGLIPWDVNLRQGTQTFSDLVDAEIARAASRGEILSAYEAAKRVGIAPVWSNNLIQGMRRGG